MQEQTTTSVSDTGDDAGDNSQDVEQASGEEDQEAEEAEASVQTSSMPFAAGYDAKETDSTTYGQ